MTETAERTAYLSSAQLRRRYGDISDMTIWRWLQDPGLEFPRPEWIRGRRFWREDRLVAWESTRPSGPIAPQRQRRGEAA